MQLENFSQINLEDSFFDSLKEDYQEFESWFLKKAATNALACVGYDEGRNIQAFLYLKVEEGGIVDIQPMLDNKRWLKVGTFKVNPHGTRLGERFVKKIFDYAVIENVDSIYVTSK